MEVVGAIIKNQANQYLLQQRDRCAPSFQYCWTLFGGVVEQYETPEQAIMRELGEELDLQPSQISSMAFVEENVQQGGTRQLIYEIITTAPLNHLSLREGESMEYVSGEALLDREFAFNIRDVLVRHISKQNPRCIRRP